MNLPKRIKKIVVFWGLILLFGINFYLYRSEFKVLIDPNDNIFQYALIDEARNIWKQIFAGNLSPLYLLDSWQERWAEGFALSSYYAHLPQAVLGLFGGFKLFVVVRTLILILMPVMFFWGARILRLGLFHCFIVSLLSQVIFTDGLYGIDATSYLWRGWGLSAQLMAVFFLPVAFAYAIDYFENKKNLGNAIFFNFLVASSHFGIFSLALLGYPLYWISQFIQNKYSVIASDRAMAGERGNLSRLLRLPQLADRNDEKASFVRTIIFIFLTLFFLSYFMVPFFLQSEYRNYSVWDPIWKFDSWGVRQTIIWLLNGDMFDFGRLPILTYTVIFGLFTGLVRGSKLIRYLSVLFIFYFTLFLGRATFGSVIDLIPGFSEFHQHRMIVMVQFVGIFIGGWFIYWLFLNYQSIFSEIILKRLKIKNYKFNENLKFKIINLANILSLIVLLIGVYYLERPLINYAKDNAEWIGRANNAYIRDLPDYERIKAKLAILPRARVYVGRPGNWGKQFTVGETPLYMVLSRDGYPTIGFLPQSWSPNSDTEQFFNEDDINFYNLYNVGYSILPENIKPPAFAKLIAREGKYLFYEIKTTGWFEVGISSIAVKSKKTDLLNSTRLWFESDQFQNEDFPIIDLTDAQPDGQRWYIEMTDKNNWVNLNDKKERNLWRANPFSVDLSEPLENGIRIKNQEVLVNGYKAQVEVAEDCKNCIVVLKQTFHPNWEVMLSGKKVKSLPVFPFYIGIPVEKAGSYELTVVYKPGVIKVILILSEIIVFAYLLLKFFKKV